MQPGVPLRPGGLRSATTDVRRAVRFGISGYDFDEVLDGLAPGEEVILSDMKDYEHLERVNLK